MNEPLRQRCRDMVAQLMEHSDSVRIFYTKHDGNTENTESFTVGNGNFHAQYGQIKEWVLRQDQYVLTQADIDQRTSEEE